MNKKISRKWFWVVIAAISIFIFTYNFRPILKEELTNDKTCELISSLGYDFCSFKGDSRYRTSSYLACNERESVQNELKGDDNLLNLIKEEYSEQIDRNFHPIFSAEDPFENFTLYKEVLGRGLYDQELYSSSGYLLVCIFKSSNAVIFFGYGFHHCKSYIIYIIPKLTDSIEDLIKPEYLTEITTGAEYYSGYNRVFIEDDKIILKHTTSCP